MANARVPAIPVRFYRTDTGAEMVAQPKPNGPARHRIGFDARSVRMAGWYATGAKLERWALGVRCTLPSRRIARLLLCFHQDTLVVLHGFVKKTQKTSAADLALARQRMKEVTS